MSNINTGDLFNNPMIDIARKAMSEEQIKKFELIGKEMYENIDYETSTVGGQNFPKTIVESAAYVIEGIKAGLHPTDLSVEEKFLLKEVYGEKWYERFGYEEKDLTEIHTLVITKKIKHR
jgi:hypothetical protein